MSMINTKIKTINISPDSVKEFFLRNKTLIFSILIIAITIAVYSSNFSPALYYDDWDQFAYKYYKGYLQWFKPDFIRPLSWAPYKLQTEIFGMNLPAIMGLRIALLSIHAFLFFRIFDRLQLFPQSLNFLSALIIIFAPNDMTRMWLLLDPFMMICMQIYVLCLLEFWKKKSYTYLVIGLILGYGSLLYYEIQLGLLLAIPLLLFIFIRIKEKKYLKSMLIAIGPGIAYLVFRFFNTFLGISGFHSSGELSVRFLIKQLVNGLQNFIEGWSQPLFLDPTIRWIAFTILGIAIACTVTLFLRHGFEKNIKATISHYGLLVGAGAFLWIAGYFPFIVYGLPPYMHWFSSRSNNPIIPGSIFAIMAVLTFIGSIIRVDVKQKSIISALLALPLLSIGILAQLDIQKETKILWNDYTALWQGVFNEVPGFKGDPHVVLVVSPYKEKLRFGERDFFTSASYNVEISRALSMFYGNDRIEGEFMYRDAEVTDTPMMVKEGVRNPPTYSGTIPYSDIVFISFDRTSGDVKLIKDLNKEFGIDSPDYNVDRFVSNEQIQEFPMRDMMKQYPPAK